jgi:hypothetical protein
MTNEEDWIWTDFWNKVSEPRIKWVHLIPSKGVPVKSIRNAVFFGTLALWAAQTQAVSISTGASSGNWAYLNPTNAKLGIGTSSSTNPSEKLTVKGGNVLVDAGFGLKAFLNASTTKTNLVNLTTGNMEQLYGGKVNILSNGNVGIGTSTPSSKLDVIGSARVVGQTDINGTLNANQDFSVSGLSIFWGPVAFNGSSAFFAGNLEAQNGLVVNNGLTVNNGGMSLLGGFDCRNDATVSGSLTVFQSLEVFGFKSFVQAHPTDDTKKIVYVAAEAGEALTLARGLSKTVDGAVKITLPEDFSLVTSTEAPLTVQLTPEGAPALLYVAAKSKSEIEVKMKKSDLAEFGDVAFSYLVEGVRDGFEGHQPIQDIEKPQAQSAKLKAVLARGEALMKRIAAKKAK